MPTMGRRQECRRSLNHPRPAVAATEEEEAELMHLVLSKNRDIVNQLVEQWGIPLALAERMMVDWQEGVNLKLKEAFNEQVVVGAQNAQEQHRSVNGLGQCRQRLSFKLEDALRQLYGADSLKDDKWMDKLNREHGLGMKPNYECKARVVGGLRAS